MAKQKVARGITVLVRYTVKATGNIVLYVENDKGDRYYVTLQSNGATSCNCVSTRKCYHIARCLELEEARWSAYRRELAVKLAAQYMTTQCVEQLVETVAQPVVPPIAMDLPSELRGYKKTAVSADISTKGSLNGAQQSAGLLSMLPSRKAKAS